MKHLEFRAFVIFALVMLALSSMAIPTKHLQGIYGNDIYAMPEPFSSDSLITYPSLETSLGDL